MIPLKRTRAIKDDTRFEYAIGYLYAIKKELYGDRQVLFKVERAYQDYDPMLKRSIAYGRISANQVLCGIEACETKQDISLFVGAVDTLPPFVGYLRAHFGLHGNAANDVRIQFNGIELRIGWRELQDKSALISISQGGAAVRPGKIRFKRLLSEELFRKYFEKWLIEWSAPQGLLIHSFGNGYAYRIPRRYWLLVNRISHIDVDSSGESPPHVFRWLENSLARESKTNPSVPEKQLLESLSRSGFRMHPGARFHGLAESEVNDGTCINLRFHHFVADSAPAEEQIASDIPSNAGLILMENDFHEISMDTARSRVIGEHWKWRPEPATDQSAIQTG